MAFNEQQCCFADGFCPSTASDFNGMRVNLEPSLYEELNLCQHFWMAKNTGKNGANHGSMLGLWMFILGLWMDDGHVEKRVPFGLPLHRFSMFPWGILKFYFDSSQEKFHQEKTCLGRNVCMRPV